MMKMCMVNNSMIVVVLFFMCWSGQVFGARNKFLVNQTNVAPAEAPTIPGLGCPSRGLCEELAESQNYECEEHTVKTKDGFILSLQRIPSTVESEEPSEQVVLQHGVFGDGANWMVTGKQSLAFVLADSGFDVWLFNGRGTLYSRRHDSLSPYQNEYWDWSWDTMAEIDVTAYVDYIFEQAGQKVHYVGHSMGTLMVIGLLAERAPVTEKMKSASLLSPIGHLNHTTNQFAKISADVFMADISYWMGSSRLNVAEKPMTDFVRLVCSFPGVDCSNLLDVFTGVNCCIKTKTLKRYLTYEPQPTSMKVMAHFCQNLRDGIIKKYDYGLEELNKKHYGTPKAPIFNVTNTLPSFPIYIAYGGADTLSDVVDVMLYIRELKNHEKEKLVVNFTYEYAHMDYLLGYNVREKVYDPMMKFMKSATAN